ncbi:MAG: response regulator transcription factor [Leptolyngbya sp. SIO3F4]|nr:response regulator transcription factor [Leptolyngbya sp. SIO3F4]
MKIIIIEDEPLMADALAEEIQAADPDATVVQKLASIKAALAYLSDDTLPDLFFSDIQLPDGLSFEIFRQLDSRVPVIFCTAYDAYALKAFQSNGIDYILKPFRSEDIQATVAKYKALLGNPSTRSLSYDLLLKQLGAQRESSRQSMLIHQGEKIIPLNTSEIAFAFLEHGLVTLITFQNQRFNVNHSMESLHEMLGSDYYRLNRKQIIHRKAVKHVSRHVSRKLLVTSTLDFRGELTVSKVNSSDFLRWLEV